jgi:hypothetical protein
MNIVEARLDLLTVVAKWVAKQTADRGQPNDNN